MFLFCSHRVKGVKHVPGIKLAPFAAASPVAPNEGSTRAGQVEYRSAKPKAGTKTISGA